MNTKLTPARTKEEMMFDEIYYPYSPDIANESNMARQLIRRLYRGKVCNEAEVERVMAHVGGYDFVDAHHYDFSDGTECKTGSVRLNAIPLTSNGLPSNSHWCTITNLGSWEMIDGERTVTTRKSGDIRIVLCNPVEDRVDYFFIPHADFLEMHLKCEKKGTCNLAFRYNRDTMYYSKIHQYMVGSFEELAKMPATV